MSLRLALWRPPPLRSALRYVVFPPGAPWELERGEVGMRERNAQLPSLSHF